jgi:hypothetical protein
MKDSGKGRETKKFVKYYNLIYIPDTTWREESNEKRDQENR